MNSCFALLAFNLFLMNLSAQKGPSSPQHFQHTVETTAPAERIWQIWTDVAHWKDWDTGLADAEMAGPFEKGAKGRITTLEGRKVKFKVVDFEPGRSYTYRTALPLGGLYVKRYWEENSDGIQFTHEVWFAGLTGGWFAKRLGPEFRKMLPGVMEKITEIAEKEPAAVDKNH